MFIAVGGYPGCLRSQGDSLDLNEELRLDGCTGMEERTECVSNCDKLALKIIQKTRSKRSK